MASAAPTEDRKYFKLPLNLLQCNVCTATVTVKCPCSCEFRICGKCIAKIQQEDSDRLFRCPQCNKGIPEPESGFRECRLTSHLQTLVKGAELAGTTDGVGDATCCRYCTQKVVFRCRVCQSFLCYSCCRHKDCLNGPKHSCKDIVGLIEKSEERFTRWRQRFEKEIEIVMKTYNSTLSEQRRRFEGITNPLEKIIFVEDLKNSCGVLSLNPLYSNLINLAESCPEPGANEYQADNIITKECNIQGQIHDKVDTAAMQTRHDQKGDSNPNKHLASVDSAFDQDRTGHTDLTGEDNKDYETITLYKESHIGILIAGGIDQPYVLGNTGIFICKIIPAGPAARDGRLRVNQEIISVNDTRLHNCTHGEAVMALKVLALCPKVKLCVTKHSEPLDRIIRCILESDEEGNIGFDMESKDENTTISWLDKDGQAEIDGSLAVGDRIIEVNGVEVQGDDIGDIVAAINSAKAQGDVRIVACRVFKPDTS